MNISETKWMSNTQNNGTLHVRNEEIKKVEEYIYLERAKTINNDNQTNSPLFFRTRKFSSPSISRFLISAVICTEINMIAKAP